MLEKPTSITCRYLIPALIALHALPSSAETKTFLNTSADGLWSTDANWSTGSKPGASDNAAIGSGLTATIAANAPNIDIATVGSSSSPDTTIIIGANLRTRLFRIAHFDASFGSVVQNGGQVTITESLDIASTNTFATSGLYNINGGSLSFPNCTLGTRGNAVFKVTGSDAASISGGSMTVANAGRLEFVFGATGVTPITLSGDLNLGYAAQLSVDGSNYTGGPGIITLVTSNIIDRVFPPDRVTVSGFAGLDAEIRHTKTDVQIVLTEIGKFPPAPPQLATVLPNGGELPQLGESTFSFTRDYSPSGSPWAIIWRESLVFDALMKHEEIDGGNPVPSKSWQLRIGKGGQVYSLIGDAIGETIPPQFREGGDSDEAPWVDEVWQGVYVDQAQHNPPNSKWFVHQSGAYLRDPALTRPFYSPLVASRIDPADRSYETVNWSQFPHNNQNVDNIGNNDFRPHILTFTKWRDVGGGVIECTLGYYNFGTDYITFVNMPWGGVRRTKLGHHFTIAPDGTPTRDNSNFADSVSVSASDSAGWAAFSANASGTDASLAIVHGFDPTPLPPYLVGNSDWRYGVAGTANSETGSRNYIVGNFRRRPNTPGGTGVWSRFYYAFGSSLADIEDRIEVGQLTSSAVIGPFEFGEEDTPLVGYNFTGSLGTLEYAIDPENSQIFLYSRPVSGSSPLFFIERNNGDRFLTWNPYEISLKPYNGVIQKIQLLGYAPNVADTSPHLAYQPLDSLLTGNVGSYIASGRTLAARTGWAYWAEQTPGASGIGSPLADDDEDGLNDLLEYALGANPNLQDFADHIPAVNDALTFSFTRPVDRFDVTYKVEATDDLTGDWTTVEMEPVIQDNGDGTETLRYENLELLFPESDRCFVRLAVNR
ncbi:hypothetical protein NT6N_19140 [Oceaniferula spumae]|uniref:Uncharacterized protein n=1 Tax=Oceaniferula spumae TaxID=2979115 RepID=A0AAT9FLR4_9BACT